MQELWFLCMAHRLNVKSFVEIPLTVIKLWSGHNFVTDGQTDPRTDVRGKSICLPTLPGGDISKVCYANLLQVLLH